MLSLCLSFIFIGLGEGITLQRGGARGKKVSYREAGQGWQQRQSPGQGQCPSRVYTRDRSLHICIDLEQRRKIGFLLRDNSWQIMNPT